MTVASLLESLFSFAALGVLVWALQANTLRWRFALGVSAFMMVLTVAISLNALPGAWMNYSTTESVPAFYGDFIAELGFGLLVVPVTLIILMAPGEALARRVLPQHLSMAHMFRATFWRSERTVSAIAAGWGLAALHLGYVSAFYLVADMLGAWSPQSAPELGALATPFPWLYPMATGAFASLDEEFTYRLFAITFLLMVTKSRWIAVLAPAVIWAFLHSTYPQEPVYIRGLELSVVGIVYGIFFLRFGLVSTLIAHYAYNAVVSGVFLLRSGDTGLALSGAATIAVVLLPAAPAVWAYLRGQGLLTDDDGIETTGSPGAAPKVEETSESPPVYYDPYSPLPKSRRIALAALAALGVVVLVFVPPRTEFGDYVEVKVDYRQATRLAHAHLLEGGVDPAAYRSTVEFHSSLGGESAHYLAQHMSRRELNETYKKRYPDRPHWHVTYFIPLEIEGYAVLIGMDGRVVDFDHWLPEEAEGPQLSSAEAQAIAEAFMGAERDIDLSSWRLVDSHTEELDARNDHWYVWEDETEKVGEASFRASISVMGDEPLDLSRYLKVPEAWSRERSERRLSDTIRAVFVAMLGIVGAGSVIVFVIVLIRKRLFQIAAAVVVALLAALAEIVLSLNSLTYIWDSYGSSEEPGVYLSESLISWFVEDTFETLAMTFVAIAFMDAAIRYVFPRVSPLAHWLGLPGPARPGRPVSRRLPLRLAWAEAVLVVFALGLFLQASDDFLDASWFHGDHEIEGRSIHDDAPGTVVNGGYESHWPSIGIVADSMSESLAAVGVILGLGCIWRRYLFRLRWVVVAVLIASALDAWGGAHSLGEGVKEGLVNVVGFGCAIGVLYFFVKWFLRGNLPAYFLLFLGAGPFDEALELLRSHNAFEQSHGYFIVVVSVVCTSAALVVYVRQLKVFEMSARQE